MAEATKTLSHIPLPAISPKVVRFLTKFRTLANPRVRQHKVNSAMTDTSPTTVNRTLRRLPNSAYRVREYLTEKEVDRLIEAARKRGRNSARDAAAILLAYRHGLRAAELCALRWSQVDLRNGRLHVNRAGRYRECSSVAWSRATGAATTSRRQSVCVRYGSWHSGYNSLVSEDGPANRQGCKASVSGPSPHAETFNGLQARHSGRGYTLVGALSRSQEFTIDSEIHCACA